METGLETARVGVPVVLRSGVTTVITEVVSLGTGLIRGVLQIMWLKDTSTSLTSLEGVDLLRFESGFLKSLRSELDLNLGDLADLFTFRSGVFSGSAISDSEDFIESMSADLRELLSDVLSLRDINGEAEGVFIFLNILKDLLSRSFGWRDIVAEEVKCVTNGTQKLSIYYPTPMRRRYRVLRYEIQINNLHNTVPMSERLSPHCMQN